MKGHFFLQIYQNKYGLFEVLLGQMMDRLFSIKNVQSTFKLVGNNATFYGITKKVKELNCTDLVVYTEHETQSVANQLVDFIRKSNQEIHIQTHLLEQEEIRGVRDQRTENSGEVETHIATYSNGFRCFITGLYPDSVRNQGIKHIFLNESTNMNQSILNSSFLANQHINSGIIRENNNQHSITGIVDIHIDSTEDKHKKNVTIQTDTYLVKKQTKVFKYSEYEGKKNVALMEPDLYEDQVVLTLSTKKDFDTFNKRVQESKELGFMSANEILLNIKDECMWGNATGCTYVEGVRAGFVSDETLFGSPICFTYTMQENSASGYKERKRRIQEEIVRRGCKTCVVKEECSKCITFRHDDFLHQNYCEIRRSNPFVSTYIVYKNIFKSFLYSNPICKNIKNIMDKRVLFTTPTQTWWSGYQAAENLYKKRNYLVFEFNEEIYVFNREAIKYYKLNKWLAAS
ncbi:hypothetical protein [Caldalkalibacillus mannanilyticus]|uniref:hypothetical protein n=1 Tax=Caldalkalibacillus mannanilyticus TaxID=1418 RepID=UPI0004696B9E|nr:hypothetical protein [Caldalkalibacillus mannanilyticus]